MLILTFGCEIWTLTDKDKLIYMLFKNMPEDVFRGSLPDLRIPQPFMALGG